MSSIISMGLIAFVAPLVLGMVNYGNYVIETTVVLVVAGILEVIVVVTLNESNLSKRMVPLRSILLFLTIFLVGLVFVFQFIFSSLVPVCLFLALFFRTSLLAVNTRSNLITLPMMILSELLFSLAFVSCLFVFISFNREGSQMLIWTNTISQVVAGIPLLNSVLKNSTFESSSRVSIRTALPLILSRLPEDMFYLLIPFIVGVKGGPEDAAALRIVGSTTKAAAKLTPVRFDTLLFYLKRQRNLEHVRPEISHIVAATIFCLSFILIAQQTLVTVYAIQRASSILLYSAPFVVIATILSPVLIVHRAFTLIFTNLLMLATLLICSFFYFDMLTITVITIYVFYSIFLSYMLLKNASIFSDPNVLLKNSLNI